MGFILVHRGFSLAELLLALLILGQIAVFSIPKVLSSQQNAQKQAVFKETIATLNDITYLGMVNRDLSDSNFYSYFAARLNSVQKCSGAVSPNCWPQTVASPDAFAFQGFKLHNGATLTSFNTCCDYGGGAQGNLISMDWNGPAGPNLMGDDQCDFILSWGTAPFGSGNKYKPGTVKPDYGKAECVTLFENLFK